MCLIEITCMWSSIVIHVQTDCAVSSVDSNKYETFKTDTHFWENLVLIVFKLTNLFEIA